MKRDAIFVVVFNPQFRGGVLLMDGKINIVQSVIAAAKESIVIVQESLLRTLLFFDEIVKSQRFSIVLGKVRVFSVGEYSKARVVMSRRLISSRGSTAVS